jgi:hypothetical protein
MSACEHIYRFGHLKVLYPRSGGDAYHIFIDNDYAGKVARLNGRWVGELNYDSYITADDVQQLGKIIEEKLLQAG